MVRQFLESERCYIKELKILSCAYPLIYHCIRLYLNDITSYRDSEIRESIHDWTWSDTRTWTGEALDRELTCLTIVLPKTVKKNKYT